MNKQLIDSMKAEITRLKKELPEIQKEEEQVFAVVDSASHMTPIMREEIHALYDHSLANVQEDISGITKHLKELSGGPDDSVA